jgi:protocatechuate 3,4-dioxygenase beta subunit
MHPDDLTRRWFLACLTASGGAGLLTASHSSMALAQDTQLAVTPHCLDDEPTPTQTEGPYFTPHSPEKRDLGKPGDKGIPFIFSGAVVTRSCRPVRSVLVDLWHADATGVYDNEGYRFRGHQYTDAEGHFRFDTIVPGLYPGRTRHFHVKYQAPHQPVLTTQHYFPDESENDRDGIFNPLLLLRITRQPVMLDSFVTVLDLA